MITGYSNIITVTTSGFDSSYQAILNYATAQGYTLPSSTQQSKSNQFVLDLKSNGLWSKLDSLSIFKTDGSSNFALVDWIRLTTHGLVNSPTFTSNVGFTGNGTSAYIDPHWNITQATQATQNSIFHGVLTNTILPSINTGYHGGGSSPYNFIRQSPFRQEEPNFIHTDEMMGDITCILYLNQFHPV